MKQSFKAPSVTGERHRGSFASIVKYPCKEIGSWDKAQVLLKQGHTYLDRDGDGEACENFK